ncbi:hypothetical protein GCM10007036_41570 [Alsobacter metallidurans]|uniref:Tellurite resistance protein TerB n=1 Tax=Alsobacter metallidurans TaxID=340221 RepID=A0A917IBW9_9HYPH|nr:tellurite resistance TerB family protein [Alsobacter metallidurans]GGH30751.1 hypothetical protein GCM10007036_41570 [Alsobacter metallidurans]
MFDAKKLLDAMMSASQSPAQGGSGQGGLGGLLGNVLGQLQQGGGAQAQGGGQGAGGSAQGGIGGLIGSVLGQATQGLQGAGRQTGVSPAINDILGRLSGGQAGGGGGDLLGRAKDMLGQNQLAGGAALGSLAGLFLGSKAGRGLAVDAAKLGGLALVGGLAYQAWQNYQQGKPLVSLPQQSGQPQIAEAPAESPFGTTGDAGRDNATALLLIRAMIAAASADGVVDDAERAHITGNLQQLGAEPDAARFLDAEFASPASAVNLAAQAGSPEVAAQVYAAARLTIDPDQEAETAFLRDLAGALGLDAQLVANIDAAAESAKVQQTA